MGFTILQGYGLTETTGACMVTRVENNVVGSVGPPLPEVDVQIASPDETGTGEILVRGPMVFKGYFKNPDATEQTVPDGWFCIRATWADLTPKETFSSRAGRKKSSYCPMGRTSIRTNWRHITARVPALQEIAVIGVFSEQERGERLHAVVVPDFEYLRANSSPIRASSCAIRSPAFQPAAEIQTADELSDPERPSAAYHDAQNQEARDQRTG